MVDTGDLKSLASNGVRVQVPPRVPPLIASNSAVYSSIRFVLGCAIVCF